MDAKNKNPIDPDNTGVARDLLHSLVPRAQAFFFYDLQRRCVWNSADADDFEVDNYVSELPGDVVTGREAGTIRHTLASGRTVLLLGVSGGGQKQQGLLVALFSRNAGSSSSFDPEALRTVLAPALHVLSENIRLNRQLNGTRRLAHEAEKELKLVYMVDEKIHGTSRSHVGLAQLIGQSGRFLGIAYSVLLLPSKRIRICARHSSWKNVNGKALDKYLRKNVLPRLQGQRRPVICDVPAVPGSDDIVEQGHQALICPLVDRFGNAEGVLAQLGRVNGEPFAPSHVRLMSHIVRKVEYVIEQSYDVMTGLMNRSGFEAQLNEAARDLKDEEDAHQIIYFDLDNLQLVNETFDREAGDEVITRFAQIVDAHVPHNGVTTRLTGDDFAMLLTHSSVDAAVELAGRIREQSRELRYLEGDRSLQVTVSIGVAPLNARSAADNDALTAARVACDSAKDHGRDRIELYDRDNQSIVRRFDDMHLVSEIQKRLDSDGFALVAQPIVALKQGRMASRFEILLRSKEEEGESIPTAALFSAAERYQMMPAIDRWVISETLARLGPHRRFLEETGTTFSINLSGQTLGDAEILSFIEEEMSSSGVPAGSVCFEVTESAAVSNLARAQAFIDALRKRGCKIALDDFGAGLSSFAYLKNFNVDTLKIDGSFIRDITENRISESMVTAITQVARVMKLKTVAEYVESRDCKALVASIGVDYAQGHAVGHPAPLEQVLGRLTLLEQKSSA